MNLTLYSLSYSSLLNSPFICPSSFSTTCPQIQFSHLKMHNFISNFIFSHTNSLNSKIISSCFTKFLNTPISVQTEVLFQSTIREQRFYGNALLEIVRCNFLNCRAGQTDDNTHFRGGAIRYVGSSNGKFTVYGSTFEDCQTNYGDGGALFVCGDERTTGYDSYHQFAKFFKSSYCCYSKCAAKYNVDSENQDAGYGSVMFIFAEDVEVFYSTAVDCPDDGKSYGAQFDIKSNSTQSSYINSTKGSSEYCIAMEYRDTQKGSFKFQNFFELTGGYISSFTDLANSLIDMSYCNFVNDNLKNLQYDRFGSIIYARNSDVIFSHFCFVNVQYDQNFNMVHFEGVQRSVTMNDCVLEENMRSLLSSITTNNVLFYAEGSTKFTNTIPLLGLGPCEGDVEPPPTIATLSFSPSLNFSRSAMFSDTKEFSESKKFSQTVGFTKTDMFSESIKFTKSDDFKETDKFSESKKFTKSDDFKETDKFSESKKFTKSDDFKETDKFSESGKFTKSEDFSESVQFSKSNMFSNSDELPDKSKSDPFSKSNTFTSSSTFTQSSSFTPSDSFTKSSEFTSSAAFSDSDAFVGFYGQGGGKDKGLPTGAIIGIAVAAAAIVIAAIIAFFIIRAKKKPKPDLEGVEMGDDETNSITTTNPIYGKNEDDPFKEDFDNINQDSTVL